MPQLKFIQNIASEKDALEYTINRLGYNAIMVKHVCFINENDDIDNIYLNINNDRIGISDFKPDTYRSKNSPIIIDKEYLFTSDRIVIKVEVENKSTVFDFFLYYSHCNI